MGGGVAALRAPEPAPETASGPCNGNRRGETCDFHLGGPTEGAPSVGSKSSIGGRGVPQIRLLGQAHSPSAEAPHDGKAEPEAGALHPLLASFASGLSSLLPGTPGPWHTRHPPRDGWLSSPWGPTSAFLVLCLLIILIPVARQQLALQQLPSQQLAMQQLAMQQLAMQQLAMQQLASQQLTMQQLSSQQLSTDSLAPQPAPVPAPQRASAPAPQPSAAAYQSATVYQGRMPGSPLRTPSEAAQVRDSLAPETAPAPAPQAAAAGGVYQGRIPGSRLRTPSEVAQVRDSLACLAERGQWVANPQPRRLPWPPKLEVCDQRWVKDRHGLAGQAADSVKNASEWNVRPGLKYEWQPRQECGEWPRFDPDRFCAAMRRLGGPLLLAGDSIATKMQDSIHNLLQVRQEKKRDFMMVPQNCQKLEANGTLDVWFHPCRFLNLCGASVPVVRTRNDRLTLAEHPPFMEYYPNTRRPFEFFLPWLSLVQTWRVRAVVLNRGPHYTPTPQFAVELKEALVAVRERYPELLIIYRAAVPGHAHCDDVDAPLKAPQNRSALPFHWGDLHEQNAIARGLVEAVGGVYLDVEPMNELRADGHMGLTPGPHGMKHDCLHHCTPGPVDEWIRFLQNALDKLV